MREEEGTWTVVKRKMQKTVPATDFEVKVGQRVMAKKGKGKMVTQCKGRLCYALVKQSLTLGCGLA